MATRFKTESTGEASLVQGHKVCGSDNSPAIHVVTDAELNAQLNEQALQVKCEVDADPNMNYEKKTLVHTLIFPIAFLMTIWAFLKTAGWALLTFIRHEELVYEPQNGKPQRYPGKKTIVKWFNLKAAMRVWWCVPQEKRGETLKPKYASIFYDRFSEIPRECRHGAASWKALDLLYSHAQKFGRDKSLNGKIADLWMNLNNSRAVRNRHRLIVRELKRAILGTGKKNPRILSVACGSAEAVIQVVKSLRDEFGIVAHVTLMDLDSKALAYAGNLAKNYGIEDQFVTIAENIKNIEQVVSGPFDVIEMLGFLDYQLYRKAVLLVSRLRSLLESGGYFLTCNIVNNYEQHFLRWVISWPMIYRKPKEVAKIMLSAGFSRDEVRLVLEPIRIHVLAICRK